MLLQFTAASPTSAMLLRAPFLAGKKASSSTSVADESGEDTEGEQLQEAEKDSGQEEPGSQGR